MERRRLLLGAGIVAVSVLVAGVLIALSRGGERVPDVTAALASGELRGGLRGDSTAPGEFPEPSEDSEACPGVLQEFVSGCAVTSLEDLREVYGEPPDANFGRMRIPALGIDAPLGTRYVGADGVMADPTGPSDIVYYDFSGWEGLGGFPTTGGNAIFAGHVDRAAYVDYAGVDYIGPGVFLQLASLGGGEVIEIDLGNGPVTYVVEWVREVDRSTNWQEILSANVPVDSITLITCGGEFNSAEAAYTHRTVVRAVRA